MFQNCIHAHYRRRKGTQDAEGSGQLMLASLLAVLSRIIFYIVETIQMQF